jgi:hypothetical protein
MRLSEAFTFTLAAYIPRLCGILEFARRYKTGG